MNRVEFMRQLESLLQSIAPNEREEALQYYNDYFDDAGAENEQEVIEALGNPARVAENIKRDLLADSINGIQEPQASDRAVMEYDGGQEEAAYTGTNGFAENAPYTGPSGFAENASYTGQSGFAENAPYTGTSGFAENASYTGTSGFAENATYTGATGYTMSGDNTSDDSALEIYDTSGSAGKGTRLPKWAMILLIVLLVLVSPLGAGLIGVLVGLIATWFSLIVSFGAVALSLICVLVILFIVGILCLAVNPWAGVALIGAGLLCGGVGILFLMLTVAMAGIATPAICRGIGRGISSLFRRKAI